MGWRSTASSIEAQPCGITRRVLRSAQYPSRTCRVARALSGRAPALLRATSRLHEI